MTSSSLSKDFSLSSSFSLSGERSNWNMEDEVESAVRPPSGQEASQRHQCNGLSEDSSSETSSYSETSRTTTVTRFINYCFIVSVVS